MTHPFRPILVIGAARSGTKLMRDTLAVALAADCVPYDVNYVWRLGHERLDHDELPAAGATPALRARIRAQIGRHHAAAPALVEKTVSNCLRVPFVDAVYPDALYVHLVRDGWDVVESVYRQWIAPPDWRYLAAKLRTFPLRQAFGYGAAYGLGVLRRVLLPGREAAGTWGPRYQGIDDDVAARPLLEVCAIQWLRCVERAVVDLAALPPERVVTLRYEAFVAAPERGLRAIADRAGLPVVDPRAGEIVSRGNVGKGRRALSEAQREMIRPLVEQGQALTQPA